MSDYPTPTSPARRKLEPITIVLSKEDKETISRHTFSCLAIDIQRDYAEFYNIPNSPLLSSKEIFRLLFSKNFAIPLHPKHVLTDDEIVRREDAEPRQLEQAEGEVRSSLIQDTADGRYSLEHPSTGDDGDPKEKGPIPELLERRVEPKPHPSNWFQIVFEQLDDHHNLVRTVLAEANTVFKTEEAKLQEVLTSVRNIVGPQVAKWIDEDVAASVEAGKLVRRDLFALDAEFNRSDDDEGLSKLKHGGREGHDEGAARTNSDRKPGKEKEKDNNGPSKNSPDKATKAFGPRTRSNLHKLSAERQLDENAGRKTQSLRSSHSVPFLVPENRSSPLKRSREEVEDNDESENEVEKSITMHRSRSSILEDSGPMFKKARCQGSHVHDAADIIASPLLSGSSASPGTNSRGPHTGTTDKHAGPSTSSHPAAGHFFPPSAFPRVRPPALPRRRHEPTAKPLQRDTMRIRSNPDTGELEIFDYESTQEYKERLTRDRYDAILQVPTVCDTKGDLLAMTELDGPHFKFDRDAWKEFEEV